MLGVVETADDFTKSYSRETVSLIKETIKETTHFEKTAITFDM